MSTTVTNSNPILASGTGGMAANARATIYPNQIKRSFKVMKVLFNGIAAGDAFTITDGTTAANVLIQGVATAANTSLSYDFPTGVTWADWKITALTGASDQLFIYLK